MAYQDRLLTKAMRARANSHSPISNFKVGAAIQTVEGHQFAGTNAEDPAFNHTIHAEQAAIAAMVTTIGREEIVRVVVAGGEPGTVCTPCGHCRQLLVEFADNSCVVDVFGADGQYRLGTTLGALLPHAFRLSNFKEVSK